MNPHLVSLVREYSEAIFKKNGREAELSRKRVNGLLNTRAEEYLIEKKRGNGV